MGLVGSVRVCNVAWGGERAPETKEHSARVHYAASVSAQGAHREAGAPWSVEKRGRVHNAPPAARCLPASPKAPLPVVQQRAREPATAEAAKGPGRGAVPGAAAVRGPVGAGGTGGRTRHGSQHGGGGVRHGAGGQAGVDGGRGRPAARATREAPRLARTCARVRLGPPRRLRLPRDSRGQTSLNTRRLSIQALRAART
jgi:hypothetical protein